MNRDHISDDELIRRLDGEVTGSARAQLDTRIAAARENGERLEQLRRRSERLSELLRELNPGSEQVRGSAQAMKPEVLRAATRARIFAMTPAMKAAAIIVVLLASTLAVPPVRAWVLEQAAAIVTALGLREPAIVPQPQTAPAPAQTPAAGDAAITYNFAVERDTLDVFISAAGGTLTVRRENRELASAEVAGSTAQVTVTGSQLRFDGPIAGARLLVPAHVLVIRLHTGSSVGVQVLPGIDVDQRIAVPGR